MSALLLYNYELDESCYKVRLALWLLGVEWQAVAGDVFPGKEHLTPTFLAMNPAGRLPILRDEDLTLHGTEAILAYLAFAHDAAGRWLPSDAVAFPAVVQRLSFSARHLDATPSPRRHSVCYPASAYA